MTAQTAHDVIVAVLAGGIALIIIGVGVVTLLASLRAGAVAYAALEPFGELPAIGGRAVATAGPLGAGVAAIRLLIPPFCDVVDRLADDESRRAAVARSDPGHRRQSANPAGYAAAEASIVDEATDPADSRRRLAEPIRR
jgi:hypothetical protein